MDRIGENLGGWSNPETASVVLWILSDNNLFEHLMEVIDYHLEDGKASNRPGRESERDLLKNILEETIEEESPHYEETNVWNDLIRFSLNRVNWDELLDSLFEYYDRIDKPFIYGNPITKDVYY